MADMFNLNNLLGQRIADPFQREEYVTVTGVNPQTQQYSGVTKSGKEFKAKIDSGINIIGSPSEPQQPSINVTEGVVQPKPPSKTVRIQKETLEKTPSIFDPGADLSMPTGEARTTADVIEEQGVKNRELAFMLAGAQLFSDVFNANAAYAAASGQAQLNIMQARNQAADALYRGRQAQMEAQSEGRRAGESALLAMAVQGQDVSGSAVQKIQGSYEAMGVFNGMREEINAVREALGYKLEEVAYDYQTRNAGIARQSAIIGSAINFGASGIGTL